MEDGSLPKSPPSVVRRTSPLPPPPSVPPAPSVKLRNSLPVVKFVARGWAVRLLDFVQRIIDAVDPALSARFLFGSIGGLLLGAVALTIYLRSGNSLVPVAVRMHGPLVVPGDVAPSLRLLFAPSWSSNDDYESYELLRRYLEAHAGPFPVGHGVAISHRRTQGEVAERIVQGSVQAAVLDEAAYLGLRARGVAVDALIVPVMRGRSTHESVMIVHAHSELHALRDLEGRAFAFTDPDSLTGYYAPRAVIAALPQVGTAAQFFSRTTFTYGDRHSLQAVRGGSVDAAAVSSHCYEAALKRFPEWRGMLRVVHATEPYGQAPLVARSDLPSEQRAPLVSAFLHMHEQPEGRAVLAGLGIERFIEPPAGLYDAAAALIARVQAAPKEQP